MPKKIVSILIVLMLSLSLNIALAKPSGGTIIPFTSISIKFLDIALVNDKGEEVSLYHKDIGNAPYVDVTMGVVPITANNVPSGTYNAIKVLVAPDMKFKIQGFMSGGDEWHTDGIILDRTSFELTKNTTGEDSAKESITAGLANYNLTLSISPVSISDNVSATITLRIDMSNVIEVENGLPGPMDGPKFRQKYQDDPSSYVVASFMSDPIASISPN